MNYTLLPSLPAASYDEIESLLSVLTGVTEAVQIDLVDGKFVTHTSWPFTESDPVNELTRLKQWETDFLVEIDCMVIEPARYLDAICASGAERVIFHIGSTEEMPATIDAAQNVGLTVGVALTSRIALTALDPYIEMIDFVQLMGIREVGQQGQPFDSETLERASKLRHAHPMLEIAVDGAVNENTIRPLKEAGVNRFAPGSAITKAADPVQAYKHLKMLIST